MASSSSSRQEDTEVKSPPLFSPSPTSSPPVSESSEEGRGIQKRKEEEEEEERGRGGGGEEGRRLSGLLQVSITLSFILTRNSSTSCESKSKRFRRSTEFLQVNPDGQAGGSCCASYSSFSSSSSSHSLCRSTTSCSRLHRQTRSTCTKWRKVKVHSPRLRSFPLLSSHLTSHLSPPLPSPPHILAPPLFTSFLHSYTPYFSLPLPALTCPQELVQRHLVSKMEEDQVPVVLLLPLPQPSSALQGHRSAGRTRAVCV
eukprot:761973-Hanusia_phi.AAC.1